MHMGSVRGEGPSIGEREWTNCCNGKKEKVKNPAFFGDIVSRVSFSFLSTAPGLKTEQ